MSLSDVQWEFAQDVAKLIGFAHDNGFKLTFGEASRTVDQQMLYYYGKSVEQVGDTIELVSGPTRTKTLQSDHRKRLAVDFNIFFDYDHDGDQDYVVGKLICQRLGDFWEALHPKNYWGGNFKQGWDTPHFGRKV